MHLSIIIPAYNEGKRLGGSLRLLRDFLVKKSYDYEVIVVDDGSTDGTVAGAEASAMYKEGRLRVIKNGVNKGKGFSVKNGIMKSSGEYILFSDADLSAPIEQIDIFFNYINKGYDIVIGSRALGDSKVKVHQSLFREMMGKIFNLFVKSILIKNFNDTQCGFKLFKAQAAKDIASKLKISGFAFDCEMLYLASKFNYRIIEVPVMWSNSPKSKVNPLFDSMNMLIDLINIKRLHG